MPTWLAVILGTLFRRPPPPPPFDPPTPRPEPRNRTAPEALDRLDAHRPGLPPLAWDDGLAASCLAHSADQAARGKMGHVGSDGSRLAARVARHAPHVVPRGQCVGAGYVSAGAMVDGWFDEPPVPGNHRWILSDPSATLVGVAVAYSPFGTPYWTAVTGR